jgi:uncharacterized protein YqcC (DUF446 family)
MNSSKKQQALLLLDQLSQELKALALWQDCRPTAEQMASKAPFHYDTLAFEQWLQFVFVERIAIMIENNQPLPSEISLFPIAMESFKSQGSKVNTLLAIIKQIDCLLSGETS